MQGKPKNEKVQQKKVAKKAMIAPVNYLHEMYLNKRKIHIWLTENKNLRIEGTIRGFDEYMNIVLEDGMELNIKKGTKKSIGTIMLKGENICLICDSNKTDE